MAEPSKRPSNDSFCLNCKKSKISIVPFLKYLEIHLDNKLLFKQHIDFLESKLSLFAEILYRTKWLLPLYMLQKVYFLSYTFAFILWNNYLELDTKSSSFKVDTNTKQADLH